MGQSGPVRQSDASSNKGLTPLAENRGRKASLEGVSVQYPHMAAMANRLLRFAGFALWLVKVVPPFLPLLAMPQ
jgi:hypothetical protein